MLYVKNIIAPFLKLVLLLMICFSNLPAYAGDLSTLINNISGDESQYCTETNCFFPDKALTNEDVIIDDLINWNNNKNLVIHTKGKGNIIFKVGGNIVNKKSSVILKAGMEPGNDTTAGGTVIFEDKIPQIEINRYNEVKIYYNPQKEEEEHKFYNPNYYGNNVSLNGRQISYMFVNNIDDLQHIGWFPSGDYALSQNIDAEETKLWAHGKGFMPIGGERQKGAPFCGSFDGNNYAIKNLYINRPEEDDVAIFSFSSGHALSNNLISNVHITQANITGNFRVGSLVSGGMGTDLHNITIKNSMIIGYGPVGSVAGALQNCFIENVMQDEETRVFAGNKQIMQKQTVGAQLNVASDCAYINDEQFYLVDHE